MPRTVHWSPPGGYLQYPGSWDVLMPIIGVQEGCDAEPAIRAPDLILSPDGKPYIYRWYIVPRRVVGGNVYLHMQVADDPERPLHDHPWDNMSVLLAGGYLERYQLNPPQGCERTRIVRKGAVVQRKAEEAHRLQLLPGETYSISLFTTGPVLGEWGFWHKRKWIPHTAVEITRDGQTVLNEGAFA